MDLVQAIFTPEVTAALLAAIGPAALIYAPTRTIRRLLAGIEAAPAAEAHEMAPDGPVQGAENPAA
jgi:hypothetical protein